MPLTDRRGALETLLMVGSPLALAVLEVFHPHVHDVFQLPIGLWLAVHYSQILLFPLAALAVVLIIRYQSGGLANLVRACMFLFAAIFVAFDTAAGIVTGTLVQAAQNSGTPDAWRAAVMTIWGHPIIGGAPGTTPVLAIAGSIVWSVGLVATAYLERRRGASWFPILLLVVAAFGLSVFRTHAWPGGPVSFGALGIAAAGIRWGGGGKQPLT